MAANDTTPMLRQYHELKRVHPGALLFFRLGDFYELFFDDAITAARELGITLTARFKDSSQPVPMCGVPHHAASVHIARLIRKGYRVAICEQTEDASTAKKLVRREVVRVITPGTAIDPQLLETGEAAFLASVCGDGKSYGVAFLDVTTGEFHAAEFDGANAWTRTLDSLESFAPREILYPASFAPIIKNHFRDFAAAAQQPTHPDFQTRDTASDFSITDANAKEANANGAPVVARINAHTNHETPHQLTAVALTPLDDWLWHADICHETLTKHFAVHSLDAFNLETKPNAVRAAGVCLRYAAETQRLANAHVTDINCFDSHDYLVLDKSTVRNLELVEAQDGSAHRSLLSVIDTTQTTMGARLLRSWLLRPSVRRSEIETRLNAVEELFNSQITRDALRGNLKEIVDLERLTARLNMNTATTKDLVALRNSLEKLPRLKQSINSTQTSLLLILYENIDELAEVKELLHNTLTQDPPIAISDGETICDGVSSELDELRDISRNVKSRIAAMESDERRRTRIATLRIRYKNLSGYYIELPRSQAARVPADYERRQTLSTAERYTTPQLKELEIKVLGADERIVELEIEIFNELRRKIAAQTSRLQSTARAVATLDALAALAHTAARRRYVKPILHDGDAVEIKNGRHPVIEVFSNSPFVPNDLTLNNSTDRLILITGPNMGGKSTILRQAGIIAVLGQIGSFVPADSARLPIFDRVWTRVGASDDISRGRSTFMVEMSETAAIMHTATSRSLVLLDEIGRGTATFDGLSIAWAVAEYLHNSPQHTAKTLFATHYHELTELAEQLPGAKNYQIRVAERDGEIFFLYRFEPGRASKSYGIEVARLAGMPAEVLDRARQVLTKLEQYELQVSETASDENSRHSLAQTASFAANANKNVSDSPPPTGFEAIVKRASNQKAAARATLFDLSNNELIDELRAAKLDAMDAQQAKQLLHDLQSRII